MTSLEAIGTGATTEGVNSASDDMISTRRANDSSTSRLSLSLTGSGTTPGPNRASATPNSRDGRKPAVAGLRAETATIIAFATAIVKKISNSFMAAVMETGVVHRADVALQNLRINSSFQTLLACTLLATACSSDSVGANGAETGSGDADSGESVGEASEGGGEASEGGADETSGGGTGSNAGEGLPCEVDEMLQTYCRSCHGPSMLAPSPMLTRQDLLGDSLIEPGTSLGQASVARLSADADKPMPPPPATAAPADLRDAFTTWVADGMPVGDCSPTEPEPDPFDVDPICTTDEWWTKGLFEESSRMNPGRACIACHDDPAAFGGDEDGPSLAAAGTLYASGHEPDDCFGIDGTFEDVYVELSHKDGTSVVMSVNEAGNFSLEPDDLPDNFGPPYLVRVVNGELERTMSAPAAHGDCNLCHTQDGDEDAPGRVLMPY